MIQDDLSDILKYYENNNEAERIERQQLEFILTGYILHHYLPPKSRILELGAGSGSFTQALAEEGHRVTAIELAPKLLEENKMRTGHLQVQHILGDARNVSQIIQESYDVILAMGPFYHLIHAQERKRLLEDLKEKLNPGGLLITTHLTRLGFFSYMLSQHPNWLENHQKEIEELWQTGVISKVPRTGVFRGYFTTLEEIQINHGEMGFELQAIHSQDPCIAGRDETFNQISSPLKVLWSQELFRISGTPLAWGSGRSLMVVAKKL